VLVHRGAVVIGQEQGVLERPALRVRELGQRLCEDLSDQVREAGEGEPSLRLRGPTCDEAVAAFLSCVARGQPQAGLADSSLAHKDGCPGQVLGRVEEPREPSKLLVPADQMPIDDLHGSP
jgi:hypothetical protein